MAKSVREALRVLLVGGVLAVGLLVAACGGGGGSSPDASTLFDKGSVADGAGVDATLRDGGVVDSTPIDGGQSDTALDGFVGDSFVGDAQILPDAGPLPAKKLVFAHGTSTSSMTLATINSDGSDYKKVPGFNALHLGYSMSLYGRVAHYYDVERDLPQAPSRLLYRPVVLPRGLGILKWYGERNTSNAFDKVGLMVIRPDGQVEVLYTTANVGSTTSPSTQALGTGVSVSDDGTLVVALRPSAGGLVLIKTNRTTFDNGKVAKEFAITPAPEYMPPTSVSIVGDWVYFVTRTGTSNYTLWRMLANGTGTPTKITLPQVAGTNPTWVDDEIDGGSDGTAVVTAGTGSSNEDLIAINNAGAAINLTKSPLQLGERGTGIGSYYSTSTRLRVSPSGKWVAYVRLPTSNFGELWLADTTGKVAPLQITDASNILTTGTIRYVRDLNWLDDKTLMVTMGSSSGRGDLFRYDVPTKSLQNISANGSKTKPYALDSTVNIYGLWRSPNGRYLYYFEDPTSGTDPRRDLRAIDLKSWAVLAITQDANLSTSYEAVTICANGSTVALAGIPNTKSARGDELLVFNQDKASPAVRVTALGGSTTTAGNTIADTVLSTSCDYALFVAGTASNRREMYAGRISAPITVAKITNALGSATTQYNYAGDYLQISSDNSVGVFAMGASSSQMTLYGVSLKASASAEQIFKTKGYQQIYSLE
ncbi:MAG: hypothetical protein H6707_05295 [Deltaproteobacteria bacterium]|nr:hypothetical protein [Deltaproteobacteria bacterium]